MLVLRGRRSHRWRFATWRPRFLRGFPGAGRRRNGLRATAGATDGSGIEGLGELGFEAEPRSADRAIEGCAAAVASFGRWSESKRYAVVRKRFWFMSHAGALPFAGSQGRHLGRRVLRRPRRSRRIVGLTGRRFAQEAITEVKHALCGRGVVVVERDDVLGEVLQIRRP